MGEQTLHSNRLQDARPDSGIARELEAIVTGQTKQDQQKAGAAKVAVVDLRAFPECDLVHVAANAAL